MSYATNRFLPLLAIAAVLLPAVPGMAQEQSFYQPLNQRTPLGHTAGWLSHIRGPQPQWVQPIQVEIPGGGDVSLYSASVRPAAEAASPALLGVQPGHVYRLRLANMPDFPDTELYPSIEILDRLHPPAGQENRYPVPIPFSTEDIRLALNGRLVTRVIYLEQPQLAQSMDPLRRVVPQTVRPVDNVLQEADRLGRPMVIVRIGGRRPSVHHPNPAFFGTGGIAELRSSGAAPQHVTVVAPTRR